MNYADGRRVNVGDIVGLGEDKAGVVVCCVSDGIYTEKYPETAWSYLKRGFLVEFPTYGLIFYDEAEDDLELVSCAPARD